MVLAVGYRGVRTRGGHALLQVKCLAGETFVFKIAKKPPSLTTKNRMAFAVFNDAISLKGTLFPPFLSFPLYCIIG